MLWVVYCDCEMDCQTTNNSFCFLTIAMRIVAKDIEENVIGVLNRQDGSISRFLISSKFLVGLHGLLSSNSLMGVDCFKFVESDEIERKCTCAVLRAHMWQTFTTGASISQTTAS